MTSDAKSGLGAVRPSAAESTADVRASASSEIRSEVSPAAAESRLTARERATYQELTLFDPQLGGLFRLGLELLPRLSDPGVAYLVAHAGREVANGVERILAGEEPRIAGNNADRDSETKERNRDRIASVLGLPADDELVKMWFRARRVFDRSCHYGSRLAPGDLRVGFEEFAGLLFGRVGPYFATHAQLEELAAVERPTREQVIAAAQLLLRPQQRRHFFSTLACPGWLEPLAEAGQFALPPDRDRRPDGSWSPQAWHQGEYLARIAGSRPSEVAEILTKIPPSNSNPAVWWVVLKAALAMPAAVGARLVRPVVAALKHDSGFLLAHDTVLLIEHLAAGGEAGAFALVYALLSFSKLEDGNKPDAPSQMAKRRVDTAWLLPLVEDWVLREFIEKAAPALAALDGVKTARLLARKLREAVALMESVTAVELRRHEGETARWCMRLDSHSEEKDPRQAFAVALSDVAARLAAGGPDQARVVWRILSSGGEIFERLRWWFLVSAGAILRDELDALIGSDRLVAPPFGAREAAALLRAQFSNASPDARRLFRYALERGPDPADLQRRIALRRELNAERGVPPVGDTEAEVSAALNEWRAKRIRWFHDRIPSELQSLADATGVKPSIPNVEAQDLDEVGWHVGDVFSAHRDTSPRRVDEFATSEPTVTADFLRDWKGPADSFGRGASRSGLEQELTAFGEQHPDKALAVTALAQERQIPLSYVAALLVGVHAASRKAAVPWRETLSAALLAVKVASERTLAEQDERRWRDPQRFTVGVALELVRDACQRSRLPLDLADRGWEFISSALRSDIVWADRSEQQHKKLGDLLDASLSSLTGAAVWTLIELALWNYREVNRAAGTGDSDGKAIPEMEDRLAPLLREVTGRAGVARQLVRAMLGRYVPQMYLLVPMWASTNEEDLFAAGATEPLANPVWPAYLARGGYFDDVFRRLRPWYIRAADAMAQRGDAFAGEDRWAPSRGLADHVLTAILRGVAGLGDADQLVEKTFACVGAKAKADVYWDVHAAWREAKEPVPVDFVKRLVGFWEWRLRELEAAPGSTEAREEADGLFHFVSTPYIPPADAIRLGRRNVKLLPESNQGRGFIWESLSVLAEADAAGTFEILEPLVKRTMAEKHPYLPFERVAPALRLALACGDSAVRERATRLVHALGESGHVDYGVLLKDGSVSKA